jgi:hypothetical protein
MINPVASMMPAVETFAHPYILYERKVKWHSPGALQGCGQSQPRLLLQNVGGHRRGTGGDELMIE